MQIKLKKRILRWLGNSLAKPLINFLCKTLFIEEENKSALSTLTENNQNVVFAFWHGTMLVPWYLLKKHSPSTVVSHSKDGNLLAKLLTSWNYDVHRGSSSKGGKEVLEKLMERARDNKFIAITPDGPKGPLKKMKAGAVIISKKCQIPLILVGAAYKSKKTLNSWDKFQIPMLFTKTKIIYSEPIYVDSELTFEETDKYIKEMEIRLEKLQMRAETIC